MNDEKSKRGVACIYRGERVRTGVNESKKQAMLMKIRHSDILHVPLKLLKGGGPSVSERESNNICGEYLIIGM